MAVDAHDVGLRRDCRRARGPRRGYRSTAPFTALMGRLFSSLSTVGAELVSTCVLEAVDLDGARRAQ